MAEFTVNAQRFDPYKNFKFRVKMGRQVRRRNQQGRIAETNHGSGQASRRRRSIVAAANRPAGPNTTPSRLNAASRTTPNSKVGQQSLAVDAGLGPKSRSRIFARTC